VHFCEISSISLKQHKRRPFNVRFYVLNSRARESNTIHLDSKDAVARSIESDRCATPNAMD
jgi:hypothetical protein